MEIRKEETQMTNVKFLGICIVLAAAIISGALIHHAQKANIASEIGRYQFQPSNPPGVIWTIDTVTGEVKARNG
ncbi:MAG: hypothetical protein ACYS8S_07960 [Planctomycetota bacterium]|jgi:hypothetical protein